MPIFEYKAKQKDAQTVFGKIDAQDREQAVEKVIQLGLLPVQVDLKKTGRQPVRFAARKVSSKDRFVFSRQLSSLLHAGVSILRALEVLSAQMTNPYFRQVISYVRLEVQGGRSFSEVIGEYPAIFSPLYVTMVRAGEESGQLAQTLAAMAEYLKQQNEVSSKVRSAMVYPALMLCFGVGTIIFILVSVMPKITRLFGDLDQELPAATRFVQAVSEFMAVWWGWLLIGAVAGFFVLKRWLKTPNGQKSWSQFQLTIPFLKEFWLKVDLARFNRTLEILLRSGNGLIRSIQLALPAVGNVFVAAQINTAREELVAGRSFGESLQEKPLIPDIMGNLIAVGEESGRLNDSLADISEQYEIEIDEAVKTMTSLIEPLMILFVGAIIGFVVIAMLLPIFQMDMFAR
ncbi:MAG: type II secretion system F family protein [Candidatus Omnitrophota bacterium]